MALVRKAGVDDILQAYRLISGYAESRLMLRRPLAGLYENTRDLAVVEEDGVLVGVGGLHVMWQDLAGATRFPLWNGHSG